MSNKKKFLLLVASFVLLKLLFFYLTPAEWGDSYRFLRAGNYLSHFSYPLDEKRLPLFPLLLAPSFILGADPVLWGRGVVLLLSVLSLVLVYRLASILCPIGRIRPIGVTTFVAFSPVFFYWTSKIYAETLFVFLVLLAFYIFYKARDGSKAKPCTDWYRVIPAQAGIHMGIICGLAFMTRFEGILLFISFLIPIVILATRYRTVPGSPESEVKRGSEVDSGCGSSPYRICDLTRMTRTAKLVFTSFFGFVLPFLLISLPYFVFRYLHTGSFSSSYFSETASLNFTFKSAIYFLSSLVFIFGFIPFLDLGVIKNHINKKNLLKHLPIFMFVGLSLLLALYWQAAIPRLFVVVIPFLAMGLAKFLCISVPKECKIGVLGVFGVLGILFLLGRFHLRSPFLVLGMFVIIPVALSLAYVSVLFIRRKSHIFLLFFAGVFASILVSLFFKNTYKTVYQASLFAKNLDGKTAFSDESGLSAWYLGDKGIYFDLGLNTDGEYLWIRESHASYILDTNEHNEGDRLEVFRDPKYKDNFELIKKFKSKVGTAETFSAIYKVK